MSAGDLTEQEVSGIRSGAVADPPASEAAAASGTNLTAVGKTPKAILSVCLLISEGRREQL